jgi:hypothetical protein
MWTTGWQRNGPPAGDGQLDPAYETIAEDVGWSARIVRRALAALKALGLVMCGSAD